MHKQILKEIYGGLKQWNNYSSIPTNNQNTNARYLSVGSPLIICYKNDLWYIDYQIN